MSNKEKNILQISAWAGIFSWPLLAYYLIIFGNRLWDLFKTPIALDYQLYINGMNIVGPLLQGAFYFLVLQAVAEALPTLLELHDDISPEEEEEEGEAKEEPPVEKPLLSIDADQDKGV